MTSDDINTDRVYKLDKPTVAAIEKLQGEFCRVFRRPQQGDDLLFFPVVLFSEDDVLDHFTEFMEAANIPPELQFATLKTKRFVSHKNIKYLDADEIAEWNDAIRQFHHTSRHGLTTTGNEDFERAVDRLIEEFARLPLIFAYYLNRTSEVGPKRECGLSEFASYFVATKTLKTLKAAILLLDSHFGEDALILARSTFENYLQLVFAITNPMEHERLVESRIGVKIGTHRYHVRANGKLDFKQIVELKSGNRLAVVSLRQMAKMSPFPEDAELYSELYGMMSEYAHSDPAVSMTFWEEGWFSSTNRTMSTTSGLLGHILPFLVLDALIQLDKQSTVFRRDVKVFLGFARRKFKTCFRISSQERALTSIEETLRKRLSRLGSTWVQDQTK